MVSQPNGRAWTWPEAVSKVPVKTEEKIPERATLLPALRPMESLRREIDRLFEGLDWDYWRFPFGRSIFDVEPFWRRELSWPAAPAVDITESDKAYEVTSRVAWNRRKEHRGESRQRQFDHQR